MKSTIEAIFFDVGGTLRTGRKYTEPLMDNIHEIMELTGLDGTPQEWMERFNVRYRQYYHWGTLTLMEFSEAELWSQWLLPEVPAERIQPIAARLNQLWRDAKSNKYPLEDTAPTLKELAHRGYRLGIISNTSSSTEVPIFLEEAGVTDLIETIVVTNKLGRRKPHPSPFIVAADAMGITPSVAAYVGNRPTRDVVGAREAGIAEVVILLLDGKEPEKETTPQIPDHTISKLSELLDLYPPREKKIKIGQKADKITPLYDCAISTMWGIEQNEHFNDFFVKCRKMGIARFELNHQITAERLREIDLNQFHINSLHAPCPADVSLQEMDRRDWMISSTDEEKRTIAVDSIKTSIDQAVMLGCRYIVVHPGTTRLDHSMEKNLRSLFEAGKADTQEYVAIRDELVHARKLIIEPHLVACIQSCKEIGEYARKADIAVGLENRYHYYDIPIQDELQILLDLFDHDGWGFIYDVGHAQALDRLGFFKHEDWLTCYADRMIGAHLHDVIGINDHQAPGCGEVDFSMVARHLPVWAFRVLEVLPSLTPEQVISGLEHLTKNGCITKY